MPAAVHEYGFLQLLREGGHMSPEEEGVSADARAHVQQNQPGLLSDQAAVPGTDGLQHQELRDDAQEARQHQGGQINPEQKLPAQEIDSREPIGGQGRDQHGEEGGAEGDEDAVQGRLGQNGLSEHVTIGIEADPARQNPWRRRQHIAEFLKGIADHEQEGKNKNDHGNGENNPEGDAPYDLHSALPPSVLKVLFMTTVVRRISSAVISPMAAPCPNSKRLKALS